MKKILICILAICVVTTFSFNEGHAKNITAQNELAEITQYMIEYNLCDYKLENFSVHKLSPFEKYDCVEGLSTDELDESNIYIIQHE